MKPLDEEEIIAAIATLVCRGPKQLTLRSADGQISGYDRSPVFRSCKGE